MTRLLLAGRYLVLDQAQHLLGRGSQGITLRVKDLLHPKLSMVLKAAPLASAEASILREFDLLTQLDDPSLVQVHDLGVCRQSSLAPLLSKDELEHQGDWLFFTRPFVPGQQADLWFHDHAGHGEEHEKSLLAFSKQLGRALALAHQTSIAHGDIKPANVLCSGSRGRPTPHLIDFGFGVGLGHISKGVSGTPAYMAPELWQRLAGASTPLNYKAIDIYAMGVLLFQLLTGALPFGQNDLAKLGRAHQEDDPPALTQTHIPQLCGLIERMLSKNPSARPSASDFVERLCMGEGQKSQTGAPGLGILPFLGRDEELGHFTQLLELRGIRTLTFTGPPGIGKTQLLRRMRWRAQRKGVGAIEMPLNFGSGLEALGNLMAQLGAPQDSKLLIEGVERRGQVLERFTNWLAEYSSSVGVVLFWDRFDESDEDLKAWLTHLLESPWFRDGKLARSCDILLVVAAREATLPPQITKLSLDGLSWEDFSIWVKRRLRELGDTRSTLIELEQLHQSCSGHPAILRALLAGRLQLDEVIKWEGNLERALTTTLQGLDPRTQTIASFFAASPIPLSMEDLKAILPHALSTEDIQERVLHLQSLQLLAPALTQRDHTSTKAWLWRWPQERFHQRSLTTSLKLAEHLTKCHPQREAERLHLWLRAAQDDQLEASRRGQIEGEIRQLAAPTLQRYQQKRAYSRGAELCLNLLKLKVLDPRVVAPFLVDLSIACDGALNASKALSSFAKEDQVIALELTRLLSAMGDYTKAQKALPQRGDLGEDAHIQLKWAVLQAEIALRTGDPKLAMTTAQNALNEHSTAEAIPPEQQLSYAQLAIYRGAAAFFAGDTHASDLLRKASNLLEQAGGRGLIKARLLTFMAMEHSHKGELELAALAYQQALDEAQEYGLDAELPIFLLNLGTAYHRQGKFGLAREYYVRGVRLCRVNTRPSTRAHLLANQANIDISLGRIPEARVLLKQVSILAKEHSLAAVADLALQLEADALASQRQHRRAVDAYLSVVQRAEQRKDARTLAESSLKAAEQWLELAALNKAEPLIQQGRSLARQHLFKDLERRANILHARLLLPKGGLERLTAIDLFRGAIKAAIQANDPFLVLEQAPRLRPLLVDHGMGEVLEEIDDMLNAAWIDISAGLSQELRADFQKHHPQSHQRRAQESKLELSPHKLRVATPALKPRPLQANPSDAIEPYFRLLSFNARIINEPKLERILPAAMDIALSLSGAERGFLLLESAGEFEVAISRNLDGDEIPRANLKYSLTIAREVTQTQAPVLTAHAIKDQRFSAAMSVQDLDLSSVLCVPLLHREEVMGALYLDHRYKHDAFEPEMVRLMRAFADQLVLALQGAQRLQELEDEKQQHEQARRQVEELLAEKEGLLKDLETQCQTLSQRIESNQASLELKYRYENIVADSPGMRRVLMLVDRVVEHTIPVVILGESGTGKEVIARAVHFNGPRADQAFIAFNCGAISENLIESELFGYQKGAFTGADRDHQGLFVAANKGTLFLDELGEMPLTMQVKLLRALQDQRVRPIGATHTIPIDVRIIAATNRDLAALVREGRFREDIFYRLAGITIELPPLRERREEIPRLVQHFLSELGNSKDISPAALNLLSGAPWPGNVRHLENVIRAASALAQGPKIEPEDLYPLIKTRTTMAPPILPQRKRGRRPKATRERVEMALKAHQGERAATARALGVSTRTLSRYLAKWDLT